MRSSMKMIAWSCIAALLLSPAWAAGPATPPATTTPTAAEIAMLKAQLDQQQKEIEQLQAALTAQRKMLEQAGVGSPAGTATPARVERYAMPSESLIASTTPMLPPPAVASPTPKISPPQPQAAVAAPASSPLQIQIGNTSITPIGFMDLTASWKDKNAGGSLGTNFGNFPYNNTFPTSKLSEFKFSPQNSRLGFRIDGDWKDTHFLAYNEFDFLGTSGANNLSVTNGAFVPRLRLFWVDVRKGQIEFLAGQSWSMMTPNRKGISALPGDLFYSQVIDVNYLIGLPWSRQPGMRVLYHPNAKVTMGFSAENPDQYMGGSGGGPQITLPAAPSPLNGLANSQLDNASGNVQNIPNLHPDFIAKVAFEPTSHVHFEVAGIERTFKIWNASNNTYHTTVGGGGSVNGNFEVVKNFRLISNNMWGDGIGRYFFGNAPDLIVRSNGDISPMHSGGFNEGVEFTHKNTLIYGYYGAVYVRRNVAFDANGTSLIGYGYRAAPNSQNKTVQEVTFGFNQTIWKDAKYGAINVMGQYAYFLRNPWYIAPNAPKSAHLNTIFFNIRYTLPGAPPAPKPAK